MNLIGYNTEISCKIHQVIFTEPKIKDLFLLLFFKNKESEENHIACENDDIEILAELADKINRDTIKALSKVYLLAQLSQREMLKESLIKQGKLATQIET